MKHFSVTNVHKRFIFSNSKRLLGYDQYFLRIGAENCRVLPPTTLLSNITPTEIIFH